MALDRGLYPLRTNIPNGEVLELEYTVASGVLTEVNVPPGWALGDFSSGVAALTFPKHYGRFCPVGWQEDTDSANSTSRHDFETNTVDVAAGTASVRCFDQNDGTTENPSDGTIRLVYLVGD